MAKKTIKYLENGEYHDATVKDVGVIEELKTESKDNLVEAINEIFLGGGKGFSDLQQKVDESTQAAQNAQQATDNLQQRLDEVAQNVGISDEEARKIINQAVEDAKKAQTEALQAYKDAQKELDDSMAQFMEEQKAINKELEQAKADIQGDIDQKNTEIEQINAVIESTKSDLTATSAQLASVRNDLTNAQMDWGKVRTEITNINGKLDSKMSNTDFDEYKERIEHNETEITQTKNELQSKATKQDLDVLTGTVTTQGSNITQLAGKLEGKVSKDTLANDIDDFQVKKANIFTGTREFMGWEFSDKALGRVNDDSYNHAKVAELHNGSNLSITVDGLEVGKTYSVSIFAKVDHTNSGSGGVQLMVDNGTSFLGVMKTIYTPHDIKTTTDWQRFYANIVASATTMKFVFDRYGMASDTTLYLNRPKLEVGDKVYAWEDNAQDIYKRVEHTETQFDVYDDQISGIVQRQTETDKKIENVSSTFTQRADGIETNSKKYTDDKTTGLAEEFSGKLKATSEQLSTEYEKQTNAKIGALSDGGSNLILNSSFLVTDDNGNATLENWRDTSSKVSLTKPNGLDGTWIKVDRATTGTALGARSNYFPVKQGKLVVGVDVALDGTGNISPYVLRIEYYDVSNNRVNYEDITLQKLGLSASQITKSGSNFRYARGVYKTSNDRSDVAKACIVVPETITGYDMYLTNFFAKFSDVNDGTYEVNPLDQQASLIKQRTKIEQDSEKINLLNTQTEKLGNDIKATNTSVNVLKGEVDLKASQSTVNDLTNRVAKNEADIKVFPDKIKSEVSEVSKKIDGVNDKVEGIQVGGTNLLRNTRFSDGSNWGYTGTYHMGIQSTDKPSGVPSDNQTMDIMSTTANSQNALVQTPKVKAGETYTVSFWGKADKETYMQVESNQNTRFNQKIGTSWQKYSGQVMFQSDNRTLYIYPTTANVWVHINSLKLEKGNVPTDWSPAPEDTDASIESVKTVATQTKDGFDRLTEKTGYNASTGEFSKVTTQINEGIKGVSSEVKSVSNRLDNLNVGGTNLLKGTSRDLQQKSTTNDWVRLPYTTDIFRSIYPLDNFTARVWIENPNKDSWLQAYVGGNGLFKGNVIKAGQSGYSEVHGTLNKDITGANLVIGAGDGLSVSLSWKELKLEKGNVPTDWSPAPEDLQEGINTATTKATQTDTKFERMISQIQYNDSTGEIGKYEHKITELANGTQEKISALTKRGNNMVIKSNFDDGTDLGGWYVASEYGSDFYRTTTAPKPDEMSSNYCLASGTRDALEANNIFPVTSGTKYYISAWVYTSQKYSGKVGLYVKNSNNNNGTHLGVAVPKDDQNRWIKIKGTITIPNGYNIAQPWLQVEKMVSDNEKIYFADISITRADDNAIELSETLTNKIGDLESTVRTNTTNIGQYRQEMTNSAKEWSTKFTSVQADLSNVNNKVDNIKVGGTNLMRNTTRDYVKFTGGGWGVDYLTPNHQAVDTPVEGGETYTFSAWVKNDSSSAGRIDLEIYQQNAKGENKSNGSSSEVSAWVSPGEEKRLVFTKTLLSDTTSVRLHTRNKDRDGIVTYWTKMAKVEKGTIATDWSPAPEDTENKIEILSGKITANSNEFSTVYTKITNVQDVVNSDGGGINLAKHTSNKLANVTASPWLYVGSESSSSFNNLKDYQGKYMTVRVWIEKPSRDTWVQIWNDKQPIYGNTIKAGQSGYSTASGVIPKGITAWNIPVGNNINGTTTTFGWKEFKIELGNVATPWSPNPDDVDNNIDTAANNARTNAKNDAINAIKGDSQWQSMGKIVTNASFLQNSDGFAQEVSKRIMGSAGQTNLYYNSEFTYTGTDPHNMDGIQSTKNVAYSKNDRWANYKGSNAVFASTRGTLSDYCYIEHKKDKYVKVQPGEVVSASVVTWVTGGSDVPRDGYAICTIAFYKDLSSSRMGYKEVSVAAKDINYPYYRTLKVENVTVPDGANYMTLHLIIRGASNWQFSQPMLVKDDHVGVYVPSTQLQLNDISSRTQFLQDDKQFLFRVQQAGGATQADVNSANSKIGDLSTRVTNTEVAITSGGVTINGNTTINGELNAQDVVLKGKSSTMALNGDGGVGIFSNDRLFATRLAGHTLEFDLNFNNTLERLGGISAAMNQKENNVNGISLNVTPQQTLGEPYGGDEISIGKVTSINGDKMSIESGMVYSATGVNKGAGFHWYDEEYKHGKGTLTHIENARDPLFWTGGKWNTSTQPTYIQPTVQLGYNTNTYGNSGVSFYWNSIKPFGTLDMTDVNIWMADAEARLRFGWINWSDWTGKIPSLYRTPHDSAKAIGGIGVGNDGNVILFGGNRRWDMNHH